MKLSILSILHCFVVMYIINRNTVETIAVLSKWHAAGRNYFSFRLGMRSALAIAQSVCLCVCNQWRSASEVMCGAILAPQTARMQFATSAGELWGVVATQLTSWNTYEQTTKLNMTHMCKVGQKMSSGRLCQAGQGRLLWRNPLAQKGNIQVERKCGALSTAKHCCCWSCLN